MDDGAPALEVGFLIDTGGSADDLIRLGGTMDAVEARVLADAKRIEQATGNMVDLTAATAAFSTFGSAATRATRDAARDMARVEKAGEAMVRQLERQNGAFGRTREELRGMKAEAAAVAAEQAKMTELAGRIRASEAELKGRENAAKQAEAERKVAEEKAKILETTRRQTNAERELATEQRKQNGILAERARIESALERTTGVGRPRAIDAGAGFSALEKAARQQEEAELRAAARAYEMFEARARAGAQAQREADAARRAAIASLESYTAKLEAETAAIGRTAVELHAMEVAQRAAAAAAAGMPDIADRIRTAGAAYAQAQASAAALAAEERRLAEAGRLAAGAERQMADDARQLRAAIDPMYLAQQRFDDELTKAERLLHNGVISQREYAQSVQLSRDNLYRHAQAVGGSAAAGTELDAANRKMSGSLSQLSFQLNDAATMAMSGSSAFQIVATQGGQVFQVFQQAQGGAKGLAVEIGALALKFAPIAGLVAVTVGPVLAAAAAWMEYSAAVRQFNALAQGAGRTAQLSAQDMEDIAEGAARAGNITVVAAREIETGYVRMGGIGKANLQDLILFTRDFAAATGTDAAAATQTLGAAFQDPIKGAADLTSQFGVMTQAQIEHIRHLVEQNDLYGAQRAMLNALEPAFDGAADHAGGLTRAWRSIRDAASEAWTAMGRAIDVALGGGSTLDKLNKAHQDRTRWLQSTLGRGDTSQFDAEIASLTAQLGRDKVRDDQARVRATASSAMNIVNSITGNSGLEENRRQLGLITGVLADNGRAAGLTADQLARARTAQQQLTHAVTTYIPEAERSVRLAQLDVEMARAKQAKDQGRVASLTAQRTELQNRGKLITATQAQSLATASSTRATLEATNSVDRHAERLVNEAKAVEAKIANTYKLADAYGVSGAAALIAEARVKAESEAINKRANVEATIDRQIRLSIAERVKASAQSTAAMQDAARVQTEVNAQMADGNVTAEQGAELVRQRIAELPLLAAIEAAQQRSLATEVARATKALEDQRKAHNDAKAAEIGRRFVQESQTASDRLADLREELRLVGATDAARTIALARFKAERDGARMFAPGAYRDQYIEKQVTIAATQIQTQLSVKAVNDELEHQALLLDAVAANASDAARGMADAFGEAGRALGDMGALFTTHIADQRRLTDARDAEMRQHAEMTDLQKRAAAERRTTALFEARTTTAQVGFYGDMTSAAKGFFDEKSKGYAALSMAEKVFRGIEFALSVRAMTQDAIETASKIGTGIARIAIGAKEAVVRAMRDIPFPLNLAAAGATAAALGALGVSIAGSFGGSSRNRLDPANDGSGSVLGDSKAQSESIKRAIDALREVDMLTNSFAREMAASLRSIDNQIGGVAAAIVRGGDINASTGIREGFASDTTGKLLNGIVTGGGLFSKVPIIGGIISGVGSLLGSLFGSSTSVIGSGLSAKSQTLGGILSGGFDAQTYSDVEKKKKFFGITTGKSYSTQYGNADPALEGQFTLLLRSFATAIGAAAGPLGEATGAVEARLAGFVVNIGKIDLKGLTGEQIAEKLTAVFGAAADQMADVAFPGVNRFQKVGEGAFETLVRVASTVEAVTVSLDQLGISTRALGLDAKMGIADQFDSVSAMTSAADAYFKAFYTPAEQNAARMSQLSGVFVRLGVTMPGTLTAFRDLVDAQDLTTAAGQSTYATLLQLAPAFAELKSAMEGAKSAADVLAEREGLQRRLLEVNGDTAAIRALDLAKLDASNRALQQQVWAIEDAKEAARAADELRQAWSSVGDSLLDEINRIRGLDAVGGGSFAALFAQFNAATASARGGDIDAAKLLPGLSQSLLKAAAEQATSRQELARIQAETAASLEATRAATSGPVSPPTTLIVSNPVQNSPDINRALLSNSAATAQATRPANDDDGGSMAAQIEALRTEIAGMRADNNAGHAATASNTSRTAKVLEAVTDATGGDAVAVASAA